MSAKNRISLSIKDSFRVVKWLVEKNDAGAFETGIKAEEIAKLCAEELSIPHLNRDHVYTRLGEMGIKLRSPVPKDPAVKNAESIDILAKLVLALYLKLGEEIPFELKGLMNS